MLRIYKACNNKTVRQPFNKTVKQPCNKTVRQPFDKTVKQLVVISIQYYSTAA